MMGFMATFSPGTRDSPQICSRSWHDAAEAQDVRAAVAGPQSPDQLFALGVGGAELQAAQGTPP
jgi:hypothetical protein